MNFQGQALYHALRMNVKEDPSVEVDPWQIEDYRTVSEEDLFARLGVLGIALDKERFLLFAENCDTPEELTECMSLEELGSHNEEKAYLLLFELWRRLCRDKRSLSLFCDELDTQIALYDEGQPDEEKLLNLLEELENIFDETADEGVSERDILRSITPFLAHDLEAFLFDYISAQLDVGSEMYASELIDGFYHYIEDQRWFDLLRLRLLFATDLEEATFMAERLIEILKDEPEKDLLFELLDMLIHVDETDLFVEGVNLALEQIKTEGDFQQLLEIAIEYFTCVDREEDEKLLTEILNSRKGQDQKSSLSEGDEKLQLFSSKFAMV